MNENESSVSSLSKITVISCYVCLQPCLGSSNTSKYFGSVDSLEHNTKANSISKTRAKEGSETGQSQTKASSQGEKEHFINRCLQEPLWLLMANTNDKVMLTYQLPSR